ncbi:polysaccharide biosynthesis tyrosine autokinase [Halomonas sp. CH40]
MSDVISQQNTAQQSTAPQDDEIDLGRLFGLLIDHKYLIVGITVLFAAIGVVYAMLATPVYQGDALVQVEQRSSINPMGELSEVLGQESESSTSAEIQILQSRMVLGQVVDRISLDTSVTPRTLPLVGDFIQRRGIQRPGFMQESPYVWGGEYINVSRLEVHDSYRGQPFTLQTEPSSPGQPAQYSLWLEGERLGTGQVSQQSQFLQGEVIVNVSELQAAPGAEFTLTKLVRSNAVNNLKSRLSIAEVGGGRGGSSGMLRLTLSGENREEIRRSLDAVTQTFLTQNVERQSAQAEQSLAFLEEQAPEIRSELDQAENRLNEFRVESQNVGLDSEAQSAINRYIELEERLNELQFQEAELAQRYTPSHPAYQALLRQKRFVESDLDELDARVSELPAAQQEIIRRTRDVEVTQAIYVNVLNKMQELQMAKAGTVGNVRIIDDALVGGAIAPKKPLIVVLATLMGGMLAVGGVLLVGLLRRGVEGPEQLEQAGLPVYASVPLSATQQQLVRKIKVKGSKKAHEVNTGVLAHYEPADLAVEALRGLRTSLHFAMMEAKNRSIMITGSSPDIGKSFITINLGAVCANAGQKVLVIDADMRKGHVHTAFNGKSEGGLSDVLSGRSTWQTQLRTTPIENLSYMARGLAPPNPSELLMNERFAQMLEEAEQEYDLVIVDTPPVLAVTDPAVVGSLCGTTLLIARFERNTVKEVQQAANRLTSAGVVVKGTILNAMEKKAASSYGYGYGYYHYSYKPTID